MTNAQAKRIQLLALQALLTRFSNDMDVDVEELVVDEMESEELLAAGLADGDARVLDAISDAVTGAIATATKAVEAAIAELTTPAPKPVWPKPGSIVPLENP